MIKNDSAYKKAKEKLSQDKMYIQEEQKRFEAMGLDSENTKLAIDPLISFNKQLEEEVKYYEQIKRGSFETIKNITDLGRLLIAYRIYRNITQKELADKLGVSEAQVSKDERNEYHKATTEKIENVKQALDMETIIQVKDRREPELV